MSSNLVGVVVEDSLSARNIVASAYGDLDRSHARVLETAQQDLAEQLGGRTKAVKAAKRKLVAVIDQRQSRLADALSRNPVTRVTLPLHGAIAAVHEIATQWVGRRRDFAIDFRKSHFTLFIRWA